MVFGKVTLPNNCYDWNYDFAFRIHDVSHLVFGSITTPSSPLVYGLSSHVAVVISSNLVGGHLQSRRWWSLQGGRSRKVISGFSADGWTSPWEIDRTSRYNLPAKFSNCCHVTTTNSATSFDYVRSSYCKVTNGPCCI